VAISAGELLEVLTGWIAELCEGGGVLCVLAGTMVGGVKGWLLDSKGVRVLTDLLCWWGARRALLRTGDPGGQGGLVVGEGEHESLVEGDGEYVVVGVGERMDSEVIVVGTEVVRGMHVEAVGSSLGLDRFIGESCVNVAGVATALVCGGER